MTPPSALLPRESVRAIAELARWHPRIACAAGFEARLAPGPHVADYSTWITVESGGSRALAELDHSGHPCLADPVWRRLVGFGAEWERPGSPIRRFVPFLIFEYDIHGPPRAIPIPSVFLCVEPLPGWQAKRRGRATPLRWVIDDALPLLWGAPAPEAFAARFESTYAALPEEGTFQHVAAMLAREQPGIRVFAALARAELGAFLERIEWPGDVERIEALTDRMTAHDRVAIQFDIAERVLGRISLELSFRTEAPGAVPPRAVEVLAKLVDDGLCCPAKAEELLRWPALRGSVERRISHVKIAVGPDGTREAKAYFYSLPVPGA